jgi:dTDP-4-amino-4,6-dideoxygalactose transaminase
VTIPLTDLRVQYASIRAEIDAAVASVLGGGVFVGGEEVRLFEREFASYCGVRGGVGVGSGTDALSLALRALGVGAGDEVITVAHTFAATAEAIIAAGARPVFVDVREDTLLMDSGHLERAVTPRTRAVIPVHLYGQVCDMDAIGEVARRRGLIVVEDAAQAHGARWKGRRVGGLGRVGCFSFFPAKNLGACGDAGAVVSDDEAVLDRVRMLADHGRTEKSRHEAVGVNSRLDALQASILRVKLRHLDRWNEARRSAAARYRELLVGRGLVLPQGAAGSEPVWHLFVIRAPGRDDLRKRLDRSGIETGVHYPVPLHLQPAFASLARGEGSLPVSEAAARSVLSLPLFPEITDDQLRFVRDAMAGHRGTSTATEHPQGKRREATRPSPI